MNFPYIVQKIKANDHEFWMAESSTLNGCVGQGETPDEATCELAANEQIWLEIAQEEGIPIPEIPIFTPTTYSGKFTVRIAPKLHEEASKCAEKQGISLNQYVNDAIVAQNTGIGALHELKSLISDFRGDLLRTPLIKFSPEGKWSNPSFIVLDDSKNTYGISGHYN